MRLRPWEARWGKDMRGSLTILFVFVPKILFIPTT